MQGYETICTVGAVMSVGLFSNGDCIHILWDRSNWGSYPFLFDLPQLPPNCFACLPQGLTSILHFAEEAIFLRCKSDHLAPLPKILHRYPMAPMNSLGW